MKVVQELDAFPKVEESYTETTAAGGGGKSSLHNILTLSFPVNHLGCIYTMFLV